MASQPGRPNVLLITLDQFRGDCLSAAGHPVVRTPNLDALAADGVRFARHYSQAAPCGPGRASLYTGTYQFNHRVVANGTPLDRRFDNVALAARRAGYRPVLLGYTDQSIDPRDADGPSDPRLARYTGVLPGFDVELDLPDDHMAWLDWLGDRGYRGDAGEMLATECERPEELSSGAFLTDRAIAWIGRQDTPWFAHLSYLRPHPPYAAAGDWSRAHRTHEAGDPITAVAEPPRFHAALLAHPGAAAPADPATLAHVRAQYFGMIGHVDHQLGRVWAALRDVGAWDDTLIIVTSDHGEMLGDHGLLGKLGYWEQSFHIPCIVRDPASPGGRGGVVEMFTENVDVLPTICEAIGEPVPAQCDGRSLAPLIAATSVSGWRAAAHWEYDWRDQIILADPSARRPDWRSDDRLRRQHLAVARTRDHAYVQFGNGRWLCFDLAADPTWRTTTPDPATVLPLAQDMLTWRAEHTDRVLANMLCVDGGIGQWPAMPAGWPG